MHTICTLFVTYVSWTRTCLAALKLGMCALYIQLGRWTLTDSSFPLAVLSVPHTGFQFHLGCSSLMPASYFIVPLSAITLNHLDFGLIITKYLDLFVGGHYCRDFALLCWNMHSAFVIFFNSILFDWSAILCFSRLWLLLSSGFMGVRCCFSHSVLACTVQL